MKVYEAVELVGESAFGCPSVRFFRIEVSSYRFCEIFPGVESLSVATGSGRFTNMVKETMVLWKPLVKQGITKTAISGFSQLF